MVANKEVVTGGMGEAVFKHFQDEIKNMLSNGLNINN